MNLSLTSASTKSCPASHPVISLDSKGLGNEIGFWIFDYPPDRELDVRSFVCRHRVASLGQASARLPCSHG
jgi:hypothetical protein